MNEELKLEVEARLVVMSALKSDTGVFLAASKGVRTGYDKAWLRDNVYTALGFEWAGDVETVRRVYQAILDIFLKHEYKLDLSSHGRPHLTWQYIHARYNPENFEEYWEEWGNKQHDAVGAILFQLGRLELMDYKIVRNEDDARVIQRLVDYLSGIEYWKDPDNGMWEEYEEVHASSVGACVAGLKSIERLPYITVPENLIANGEYALHELLPRESVTKFCDLALLSLIYPYQLVNPEMEKLILKNIEYHLVRARGVIRYKTDRYYNGNDLDKWSEEAEWTMGLPWLAIIYARQKNLEKAEEYLSQTKELFYDGMLPELYYSNREVPNENIPLAWAESLYTVALIEVDRLRQDTARS